MDQKPSSSGEAIRAGEAVDLDAFKTALAEGVTLYPQHIGLLIAEVERLRASSCSRETDTRLDYGPDPNCRDCKGSGECSNAQFRCACRWRPRLASRASAPTEEQP